MMKELEAFEMRIYRRILKISWVDYVTNVEVLRRVDKKKETSITIKKKKIEYLGNVLRNGKF